MGNFEERVKQHAEAIERMKSLKFGDPVTNVCAGDKNPELHAYFVEYTAHGRKNRFGIVHRDHWAKCTDRKGKFWNTGIKVIFPGHLDAKTREALFAPIWQAEYGAPATAGQGMEGGS